MVMVPLTYGFRSVHLLAMLVVRCKTWFFPLCFLQYTMLEDTGLYRCHNRMGIG